MTIIGYPKGESLEPPDASFPDTAGDLIKRHWWKVLTVAFVLGGAWTGIQAQLAGHGKTIERLEAETQEHHDFIVAQKEVNKKIDDMSKDVKVILRHVR